MTKEEAIKYLQELYPNGGHCWLDEQRIEAIGMAVKALQEEPLSEDLEEGVKNRDEYKEWQGFPDIQKELIDFAKFGNQYKEPVSEDLEKAANEWDAKASFNPFYMALDNNGNPYEVRQDYTTHAESFKAGAKWQKLKDMGITNNAKGVVTNILNSSDKSLDTYATEVAFIMIPANLTENYHMTNRDRISDAVRLGAQWQKEKEYTCYEEAFEDGAQWQKEQMMANAIDAQRAGVEVNDWKRKIVFSFVLPDKDYEKMNKVKVIVIKEG